MVHYLTSKYFTKRILEGQEQTGGGRAAILLTAGELMRDRFRL